MAESTCTTTNKELNQDGIIALELWWSSLLDEGTAQIFTEKGSSRSDLYNMYKDWVICNHGSDHVMVCNRMWRPLLTMMGKSVVQHRPRNQQSSSRARIVWCKHEEAITIFASYMQIAQERRAVITEQRNKVNQQRYVVKEQIKIEKHRLLQEKHRLLQEKHATLIAARLSWQQKREVIENKRLEREKRESLRQNPAVPHIVTIRRNHASSSGEEIVEAYLRIKHIPYTRQQPLLTVDYVGMGGGGLTFDFYIAAIKLAIEVDGNQHYEPVEAFGGVIGFINILRCDLLKREWCEQHSTSLLRMSYSDLSHVGTAIDAIIAAIRTVPLHELPCIADEFHEERQRLYTEYTSAR